MDLIVKRNKCKRSFDRTNLAGVGIPQEEIHAVIDKVEITADNFKYVRRTKRCCAFYVIAVIAILIFMGVRSHMRARRFDGPHGRMGPQAGPMGPIRQPPMAGGPNAPGAMFPGHKGMNFNNTMNGTNQTTQTWRHQWNGTGGRKCNKSRRNQTASNATTPEVRLDAPVSVPINIEPKKIVDPIEAPAGPAPTPMPAPAPMPAPIPSPVPLPPAPPVDNTQTTVSTTIAESGPAINQMGVVNSTEPGKPAGPRPRRGPHHRWWGMFGRRHGRRHHRGGFRRWLRRHQRKWFRRHHRGAEGRFPGGRFRGRRGAQPPNGHMTQGRGGEMRPFQGEPPKRCCKKIWIFIILFPILLLIGFKCQERKTRNRVKKLLEVENRMFRARYGYEWSVNKKINELQLRKVGAAQVRPLQHIFASPQPHGYPQPMPTMQVSPFPPQQQERIAAPLFTEEAAQNSNPFRPGPSPRQGYQRVSLDDSTVGYSYR